MKRAFTILALAALHFIVSLCLFGILYSRGMAAFDRGSSDATLFDSFVGYTVLILWFPFYPLAWWLNIPSGSTYEWSLLFATSVLWGFIIYFLFGFIARWRKTRVMQSTPTV